MKEDKVKQHLGILIDYSRDKDIPEQGLSMLTAKGFYKREGEESPQESFARGATCYSFGDYEFAQRIYDYVSKGYFTFASPVLSNAVEVDWPTFSEDQFDEAAEWLEDNVEPDGMPISCFLSMIDDSKQGLTIASDEAKHLSMMGGGVGIFAAQRSPDEKSTGVMAHSRDYDAMTLAYRQTASRRGSMAMYLDIDHPEIVSFLQMRNPIGGDSNKKCFNLNHGINITDKFMEAVIRGEEYELIDPKHGSTGRKLKAREVWEEILELRKETGEPYLLFKDTVNRKIPKWITKPTYKVQQSNLCVAPETLVLTDKGHIAICELEGQQVNVWNGKEFSEVTVFKTGEDAELVTVKSNQGFQMDCTKYHKFYVMEGFSRYGRVVEKRANELSPGDKLIKLDTPVIHGGEVLNKPYENGFYSGDGCCVNGHARIYLYGEKMKLFDHFRDKYTVSDQPDQDRVYFYVSGLQQKFFVPDASYDVKSRVDWFAGLLDSDGCVLTAKPWGSQTLQIASTQEGFLESVQLMLQTLGVQSKVTPARDAGVYKLPANDGTGELKDFTCAKTLRLLVNGMGILKLLELGMKTNRLLITGHVPNRDASGFVTVESVTYTGRKDDTYCFNEPLRHMGVFNGLLTGQCSEITLMTSFKRTAVCCLSSLNLEKFDEWKETNIVQDLVRLLDNVLEYFIRLAPKELGRAIYSASKERALGIGTLGWHSYLQSKMIPFEGGGFNSAIQHTHIVYGLLQKKAIEESRRLAVLRGEAPDCEGSGMRNSHLFAIAPNASSSSLVGASPSIEPWAGCAFNAEGRAGSFLIKNKYLKKLLQVKEQDTDEVWSSIIVNESVQHLEFLTDEEKAVFKTGYEINPMWVVEQATERQPYICQSQSLNLLPPADITAQELSDIHITAWAKGLKSLYYCRGKGASKANIGTGTDKPLNAVAVRTKIEYDQSGCLACEG